MVKIQDDNSSTTEEKILEAAKDVFIKHGLEGTTMQQIADEARINKSLLHYYFRTKEKLFGMVVKYALKFFVPQIQDIMNSNDTIFVKIEKIVGGYIDMLSKNRLIPAFILNEINRNPDNLFQIMKSTGVDPRIFIGQFEEEIRKGTIRPIDSKHLIMNILALCVFPFAARPLVQRIFFAGDEAGYEAFLAERKQVVTDFIIHAIKA
jgi:TetR/AcrR family transcriptional regulator